MAQLNLNLGGIVDKFRDFLTTLIGEKTYVFEPGKPVRELTPEEAKKEDEKRSAEKSQPSPEPQVPSPTPSSQPVRSRNERSVQREGKLSAGGGEGSSALPGFRSKVPPDDIEKLIVDSANKYDVNPSLLAAMLFQESNFRPDVIAGPTGNQDFGVAQINEQAYPNVSRDQALDPNYAIPFAARKLSQDIASFGGDTSRGVAAYNVGRGGANVKGPEAFGGGPKGQTYIDSVSRNLTADLINQLGIKISPSLLSEYGL